MSDGESLVNTLVQKHLGVPYFGQSKKAIAGLHEQNLQRLLGSGALGDG